MRALVLSAGYGERLRPLTDTVPKPLVEIGGRPLIHYPLMMLRHAGFREVAVNVHHLGGQIEAALGRGDALGLAITYSPEPQLLGTGGTLLALRDYFRGAAFVILNCDTIMDLDLSAMIEAHRKNGGVTTMALREAATPEAYSRIEIDPAARVRRMRLLRDRARGLFDDYPAALSDELAAQLAPYMYCGAMVCQPELLDLMPPAPPFGLMTEVFAPLAAQAIPLFGYVQRGYFRTVDDLDTYHRLRAEADANPPRLPYLG